MSTTRGRFDFRGGATPGLLTVPDPIIQKYPAPSKTSSPRTLPAKARLHQIDSSQRGPRADVESIAGFVQDDWRLPRNDVNLGLRYSYVSPMKEPNKPPRELRSGARIGSACPALLQETGRDERRVNDTGPSPDHRGPLARDIPGKTHAWREVLVVRLRRYRQPMMSLLNQSEPRIEVPRRLLASFIGDT